VPEAGPDRDLAGPQPDRRWLLLSVLAPPRGEELLLIDAMRRLGARAVERQGERFVGWFPGPPDVEELLRKAAGAIRASTSLEDPGLTWSWQPYQEWADRWTRELAPRRVTARIVVAPARAPVDARPNDIVIRLQPGAAFGTAEHPTTRLCLAFLDPLVRPGDRIVDVGTGSGILAIAAAHLGALDVLAVEADPHACADARANVRLNAVHERVRLRELTISPANARWLGRPDGLIANLEWGILRPLLPSLAETLEPSGWLIVAGPLVPERPALLDLALDGGLTLQEEAQESGWWGGRWSRS
jgi:ribosomal protein L11 methyltransferase